MPTKTATRPANNRKVIVLEWLFCSVNDQHRDGVHTDEDMPCPNCIKKEVAVGLNDLTVTHPKLAAELRNAKYGVAPERVSKDSSITVEWPCRRNKTHFYSATVADRVKNPDMGCPSCS